MRGKVFLILVFVFSILSVSFISALDTQITLKVNPNAEVDLKVLNPETIQPYQAFFVNSSEAGLVKVTFSGDVGLIAISAVVRKEGKIVQYIKASDYGNFSTSGPIDIDTLIKIETANTTVVNLTLNSSENANTTETVIQNSTINASGLNSALVGKVVGDINATNKSSVFSGVFDGIKSINYKKGLKITGYVVLGIVVLAVIFLVVTRLKSRMPFSTKQLKSPQTATAKLSERELERELQEKERKLKDAQTEINKLKNQGKISEIEKRIEAERKEIEKLRKGE
jgi:hypothetical protein